MPKPKKRKRLKATGAKSAGSSAPSISFLQALEAQRERAQSRERTAAAVAGAAAREAPTDAAVPAARNAPAALPGFDFDPLTKRYFRRTSRTVPAAVPAPPALQRARVHTQLHGNRRGRGHGRVRGRGRGRGRGRYHNRDNGHEYDLNGNIGGCRIVGQGRQGRASRLVAHHGLSGLLRGRECGALSSPSVRRSVRHGGMSAPVVGAMMQRWRGSMVCMRRAGEAFNDVDAPAALPGVCALAAAGGGLYVLGASTRRSSGEGWAHSVGDRGGGGAVLGARRAAEGGSTGARAALRCIATAGAIGDTTALREGGRCLVRWGGQGALGGMPGTEGASLPLASATLGAAGNPGKVYIHRFDLGSAAAPARLTLLHRFEPAPFATLRAIEWTSNSTNAPGAGVGPHLSVAFEGRGQNRAMALTMTNTRIEVNTVAKFVSGVMAQAWAQPGVVLNGQRDGVVTLWDTRAARLAGAAARVNGCCTCMHVSNDGTRLLVAAARRKHSTTRDSPLVAFDLRMCRGEPGLTGGAKSGALFTLRGHRNVGGRFLRFALDPTQQFVAMGGDVEDSSAHPIGEFRGCVRVWSLRNGGALLRCLPLNTLHANHEQPDAPTSVTWVPSSAALQLLPARSAAPFCDARSSQHSHWDAASSLQHLQLWATGPAGLHATMPRDTPPGGPFGLPMQVLQQELLDSVI